MQRCFFLLLGAASHILAKPMENPPMVRWASPRDGETLLVPSESHTRSVDVIIDVWDGPPVPTRMPTDVYLELRVKDRVMMYFCPEMAHDVETCRNNASSPLTKNQVSFAATQLTPGPYSWTISAISQSAPQREVFAATTSFSIQPLHTSLIGIGASQAVAGITSSFQIAVPYLQAATFTVRLEGPSKVVAQQASTDSLDGLFDVSYVVAEAGNYSMHVYLEHFTDVALRDPGDLSSPFGYQGMALEGSPFTVEVVDAAVFSQPRTWCEPFFQAGSASGRWVHRGVVIDNGWYSATEVDVLGLHWVWVPFACLYRLLPRETIMRCLSRDQGGRHDSIHFIGSSMERTYYFELWKQLGADVVVDKSHGNLVHNHQGIHAKFHFMTCGQDYYDMFTDRSLHSGIEMGRIRYNRTLLDVAETIRDTNRSSDILFLGAGTCDIGRSSLADFERNMELLYELVVPFSGSLIWVTPSTVHESKLTSLQKNTWLINNPRMREIVRMGNTRFASTYRHVNVFEMTAARHDDSSDGIHYYDKDKKYSGGPTVTMAVQVMLNMIC